VAGARPGHHERHRLVAIEMFLVTASGISVPGIGSAFWGLLVAGVVMLWLGWTPSARRRSVG
jgi:benzoate membrane transport protein